jgi:hypothetical protein
MLEIPHFPQGLAILFRLEQFVMCGSDKENVPVISPAKSVTIQTLNFKLLCSGSCAEFVWCNI